MSILLLPVGSDGQAFNDANGAPRSGAKLFVYLANTSTKATIYQNESGATAHANPIILNSSGQVANGSAAVKPIFADSGQTFDVVLAPSNDTDPPASAYFTLEDISLVNDAAIASIDEWIDGTTPTYVSATSFTVTGDQSSIYHVGRRVKTTNSGGTIYSSISAVAYTTLTTVTVINDSGTLDSGLSAVSYGLLTASEPAVPGVKISGLDWTHHGIINTTKEIILGASSEVSTANSLQNVTNTLYHLATGTSWIFKAQGTGAGNDRLKIYVDGVVGCDGSGNEVTGGKKGEGTANFIKVFDDGNRAYSKTSMFEYVGAIATNSTNAQAHSLTTVPTMTQYRLRCTTGELGYSINDEVEFHSKTAAAAAPVYSSGWCDATNIGVVLATEILIRHKSTFADAVITNGNWNLVMRAWK